MNTFNFFLPLILIKWFIKNLTLDIFRIFHRKNYLIFLFLLFWAFILNRIIYGFIINTLLCLLYLYLTALTSSSYYSYYVIDYLNLLTYLSKWYALSFKLDFSSSSPFIIRSFSTMAAFKFRTSFDKSYIYFALSWTLPSNCFSLSRQSWWPERRVFSFNYNSNLAEW